MDTMIRYNPTSRLYETYPAPESTTEDENSSIHPAENSVKYNKSVIEKPVARGKP